jgi:hypothetical protein
MSSIQKQLDVQKKAVEDLDAQVSTILAAAGDGKLDPAVIEQQIKDATDDAIEDVLETLDGLDLTELKTRTDLQARQSEIQNTYNPDTKFFMEFFSTLYSVRDELVIDDVRTVAGDDSIDVSNVKGIEVGKEYVLEKDGVTRFVTINEIFSDTRVKATAPINHSFTGATMKRTDWKILNGEANLTAGDVYYSKPVNLDTVSNTDKALVIRRRDNAAVLRIFCKKFNGDWIEQHWDWKRDAKGVAGFVDYEFTLKERGDLHIKIVADGSTTVKYMIGVSRATGLRGFHNPPLTPTCVLPADGATGLGETPALATTAYTHPAKTAQRGTVFEVSKKADDFTGDNLVYSSGEVVGIAATTAKGKLQTNTKYYQRAKHVDALDGISEWSAVTCFTTTGSFVTVDQPTGKAPVAGAELSSPDGLTLTSNPFATTGGSDTHAASQWQIAKNPNFDTIHWDSNEDSANKVSKSVPDGTAERGETYYWRCRHKGANKGWSDWSAPLTFSVINIGNGVRVDGGIAISHTFTDGQQGYIIVAPASKRTTKKWGLYNLDTSLANLSSASSKDPKSGAQNTSVLCSGSYSSHNDGQGSVGAPAAEYCDNLIFEGCNDFFLPNKEELAKIISQKAIIDAADETSGNKFSSIGSNYIWSSSEDTSNYAWVQRPSDGQGSYGKGSDYFVVPCRRFIP